MQCLARYKAEEEPKFGTCILLVESGFALEVFQKRCSFHVSRIWSGGRLTPGNPVEL